MSALRATAPGAHNERLAGGERAPRGPPHNERMTVTTLPSTVAPSPGMGA